MTGDVNLSIRIGTLCNVRPNTIKRIAFKMLELLRFVDDDPKQRGAFNWKATILTDLLLCKILTLHSLHRGLERLGISSTPLSLTHLVDSMGPSEPVVVAVGIIVVSGVAEEWKRHTPEIASSVSRRIAWFNIQDD